MALNRRTLLQPLQWGLTIFIIIAIVITAISLIAVQVGSYSPISLRIIFFADELLALYTSYAQVIYAHEDALWVILLVLLGAVALRIPRFRLLKYAFHDGRNHEGRSTKALQTATRIVSVVLGGIIASYQHLLTTLPVGADTLSYVYGVNSVIHNGAGWAFTYTDYPVLLWISTLLKELSALPTPQALGLVTLALAIGLGFSVWKYCGQLFRNSPFGEEITTVAVIFTATSLAVLRSSIDLYASLLGQVLLMTFLYLDLKQSSSGKWFDAALATLTLIILLMSYWAFWVLAIVIGVLSKSLTLTDLRRFSWIILPSLLLFSGLVIFSVSYPPPAYWGVGRSILLYFGGTSVPSFVSVGSVAPGTPQIAAYPSGPYLRALFGEGNIIFGLLALFGLLFLDPRVRSQRNLYLLAFFFGLGTISSEFGIHSAVAFPSTILAALGMVGFLRLKVAFRREKLAP